MNFLRPSFRPLLAAAIAWLVACSTVTVPDTQAGDPPRKRPAAPAPAQKDCPKKPQANQPDPVRKLNRKPEPRETQQQLDAARRELEHARDSLHEAQKELAAKAETIESLQGKLSALSKQLEKAQGDVKTAGSEKCQAILARELEAERAKVAALQKELRGPEKKAENKPKPEPEKKPVPEKKPAPAVVAPPKAAPPKAAPPARAPGQTLSIAAVPYDKNSAVNYRERDRALGQVRAALKQHPAAKIALTGHADDSRYAETNLEVSQNRARFLAAHFSVNGIPRDRLEWRGVGNTRPVRGQPNRRVEIEIRP